MVKSPFKSYKYVYLFLFFMVLVCAGYGLFIKSTYKDYSNDILSYRINGLSSHLIYVENKLIEQNITKPTDLIEQSDIIVKARLVNDPTYYDQMISQPLIITDVLKGEVQPEDSIILLESFYWNNDLEEIYMIDGSAPCVKNQDYLLFLTKRTTKYEKEEGNIYYLTSHTPFGKYNLSDTEIKLFEDSIQYKDITSQTVLIAEDEGYLKLYNHYKHELFKELNLK